MSKSKTFLVFLIIFLISGGVAAQSKSGNYIECPSDHERQEARSKELQQLVKADQEDRQSFAYVYAHADKIIKRDLKRRQRVGEIFAEGCFKIASDYAAAALIYQHGDVPDHFYQTYIWAKHAIDLGDIGQKWLMGAAIDRYLVYTGQKQLFATQFYNPMGKDPCSCMEPVEPSFPASVRKEISGVSIEESYANEDFISGNKNCPHVECSHPMKDTPQGSFPGVW